MRRLKAVRAWRNRLRGVDPVVAAPHLSPEGARLALDVALDALSDDALAHAVGMAGVPYAHATVVCARTVFTASLEWCAVLLARGTAVTLKLPAGVPGLGPEMLAHAAALGLPLQITDAHGAVRGSELVVAMGSDATIEAIRAELMPGVRFLGFGHRFSVAWIREVASLRGVAESAALHDGAGCMSPVAVFTDLPLSEVVPRLAEEMASAAARWPRGPVAAADAAQIRTRGALARVVGTVAEGPGWSVHGLPAERFLPASLPRSLAVHRVSGFDEVHPKLGDRLSTLGTDDPEVSVPGARVCAPGEMQRPPLNRLHDGVDWLQETLRR